MSHVKQINQTSFQTDVLNAQGPVLVDFYADWCGPCKAQSPLLDDLAANSAGQLEVVKVDIDQAPELAQQFGVRSIPTLVLFKNGKPVDTRVGVQTQTQLRQMVT